MKIKFIGHWKKHNEWHEISSITPRSVEFFAADTVSLDEVDLYINTGFKTSKREEILVGDTILIETKDYTYKATVMFTGKDFVVYIDKQGFKYLRDLLSKSVRSRLVDVRA